MSMSELIESDYKDCKSDQILLKFQKMGIEMEYMYMLLETLSKYRRVETSNSQDTLQDLQQNDDQVDKEDMQ